jgi:hypothetical protein
LSESDEQSTLRLITGLGPEERNNAILYLSDKLAGTKSLTICDPYFLKKQKSVPAKVTATEFVELLPQTLKRIELFTKPRARDKEFADHLNAGLRGRGIRLVHRKTEKVHDRVWIKDFDEAFVVGTSFNGLGNKCAFILDLPQSDKRQFISSLNEIGQDLPKSKSA